MLSQPLGPDVRLARTHGHSLQSLEWERESLEAWYSLHPFVFFAVPRALSRGRFGPLGLHGGENTPATLPAGGGLQCVLICEIWVVL